MGKVRKVALIRLECRQGAHLHFQGREPIVVTHDHCDARPTVTFPPCAGTKLILFCDRHLCEQLAQGCTRKHEDRESNS